MSDRNYFTATKNGSGDNWPICWTGQDAEGNHFGVSTVDVRASQLEKFSQGAEGDAKLIAALLDRHYSGRDEALQTRLADLVASWKEKSTAMDYHSYDYGAQAQEQMYQELAEELEKTIKGAA